MSCGERTVMERRQSSGKPQPSTPVSELRAGFSSTVLPEWSISVTGVKSRVGCKRPYSSSLDSAIHSLGNMSGLVSKTFLKPQSNWWNISIVIIKVYGIRLFDHFPEILFNLWLICLGCTWHISLFAQLSDPILSLWSARYLLSCGGWLVVPS